LPSRLAADGHAVIPVHTSICVLIYCNICVLPLLAARAAGGHAILLVHTTIYMSSYTAICVSCSSSCGESSRRTRNSTSTYHYICVLIYCHMCVSCSSSCGESSRLTSSSRLTKPPPRLQQAYAFYVAICVRILLEKFKADETATPPATGICVLCCYMCPHTARKVQG
jgi:hypothetical protein